MRKISIIHPSRGRAKIAVETASKWLANADNRDNIQYILSIDNEPEQTAAYSKTFGHCGDVVDIIHANDNRSLIDATNNGMIHATGDIIIVVSDDFDCPEHWDTLLLNAIGDKTDFVAKTDDGCQPWIMTLPLMDRAYYNRFGYIYYPGYRHMFCDTEMTHVGDLLGRSITLPIKFPHMHYMNEGGMEKDEINVRNDASWAQGEALYLSRMADNFGIENPLPIKLPKHHFDWLRTKGVFA